MHRDRWRVACLALLLALSAPARLQARVVPGWGTVSFPTGCAPAVQGRLETALARLHSFDGPEDAFVAIAKADPHCGIAWWGAAMSVRGNPLAGAPSLETLKAGQAHIGAAFAAGRAIAAQGKTSRGPTAGLIDALGVYYADPRQDHAARTQAYEAAMKRLASAFPDDAEVQSFTALAILEAVDLTDKSLHRQHEAAAILERVWAAHPDHPGAPHYLIHADDYPPLAAGALEAAKRYPEIAPASVHARHMPSHIYSMLGLWRQSIAANEASAGLLDHAAHQGAHRGPHEGTHLAQARLDSADPHGMDFIAYARLQLAQDREVAAALAQAAPSEERTLVAARFLLERGDWPGAAAMPLGSGSPLDQVTIRFVRAIGAVRSARPVEEARREAAALRALREPVERAEGGYWAGLVDVYGRAAEAWIAKADGRTDEAVALMGQAADLDDAREKHILLENKLLPMRELYGELLLDVGRPADALAAFEGSRRSAPNRLRGELGIAQAARALGRPDRAREAYGRLATLAAEADPGRPEISEAKAYLDGR